MSKVELAREAKGRGFEVVQMSEHDLHDVVEIEETTGLSRWGWEAYRKELGKGESIMLVALELGHYGPYESRVSGFIAARVVGDEMHVNNIGVRDMARGRGIGAALLGRALELAEGLGAEKSVLEVRAGNLPAQVLYEKFGFVVAGRRRNYYREPPEDALVMLKVIGSRA